MVIQATLPIPHGPTFDVHHTLILQPQTFTHCCSATKFNCRVYQPQYGNAEFLIISSGLPFKGLRLLYMPQRLTLKNPKFSQIQSNTANTNAVKYVKIRSYSSVSQIEPTQIQSNTVKYVKCRQIRSYR